MSRIMSRLKGPVAGVVMLIVLLASVSLSADAAGVQGSKAEHLTVTRADLLKSQRSFKAAFDDGKLVVVKGGKEEDLEKALAIELPRVLDSVRPDKTSETPLNASAVGIIKKRDGGYHLVHFVGDMDIAESVAGVRADAFEGTSRLTGDPTIQPQATYTTLTGSVLYQWRPYGQLKSRWELARTITSSGEHLWTAHFIDNITPGEALKNSGYRGWAVDNYLPKVNVSWSGQSLEDAGPATVGGGGTFTVNLTAEGLEAGWSWTVPSVGVSEVCDWNASHCNWDFSYAWGSNSSIKTTKQEPGVMAKNTTGRFVIRHDVDTQWISFSQDWGWHDSVAYYTVSVSDF